MTSRPLHAVVLPAPHDSPERLLSVLSAALDGSGPAILPLDPGLPQTRLDELLAAFAPNAIVTSEGTKPVALPGAGGGSAPGVGEDVAVVLTTSGSTGVPKGAELSAAAMLASAHASLARLEAGLGERGRAGLAGGAGLAGRAGGVGGKNSRWLCCLPTHHISGLGVLVRSLVSGTEPLIVDRIDADLAGAADCDYVSLVPTQLQRLLAAGAPVSGFRAILLGGAAAPAGLLEAARAAGARVVTTYGMTETCGGCVYGDTPLDGVRLASGPDGRIRISGPVLFSRYRLAPELTSQCLVDGWFLTSDLGGLDAEGRLVLHGRADDVINSGGEKIVPGLVEQALRECPCVKDAVVVGVPDPEWGERVTAVVVAADESAPPDLADLRAAVAARLPRYAAPRAAVFVPEIPMLTSGKPDRLAVRMIAARQGVQ
ncbi:MAG TPA: AMP-binding protein [Streptosporangiaceae bacterium]|nr:AMP-binding protein [Streptosporangiaceae bacterium]